MNLDWEFPSRKPLILISKVKKLVNSYYHASSTASVLCWTISAALFPTWTAWTRNTLCIKWSCRCCSSPSYRGSLCGQTIARSSRTDTRSTGTARIPGKTPYSPSVGYHTTSATSPTQTTPVRFNNNKHMLSATSYTIYLILPRLLFSRYPLVHQKRLAWPLSKNDHLHFERALMLQRLKYSAGVNHIIKW